MEESNKTAIFFDSHSSNEAFARTAVSAFVSQLDPTVEELADIKTAVSEAVTNCIVHAYRESFGRIYITVRIKGNEVKITVKDKGIGIENIERALEPEFTTGADDERSGIGFSVMAAFTDKLSVRSKPNKGTTVTMIKKINAKSR